MDVLTVQNINLIEFQKIKIAKSQKSMTIGLHRKLKTVNVTQMMILNVTMAMMRGILQQTKVSDVIGSIMIDHGLNDP